MEALGHTIKERGRLGRTELIKISGSAFHAVANSRGDDHAAGYKRFKRLKVQGSKFKGSIGSKGLQGLKR